MQGHCLIVWHAALESQGGRDLGCTELIWAYGYLGYPKAENSLRLMAHKSLARQNSRFYAPHPIHIGHPHLTNSTLSNPAIHS